jgi:hypothetical protein
MDIFLILLLLIPITALIDYFLFRKRIEQSIGHPPGWYYFVWPSVLEIGMFILGYIYGSGTCQ